jgi:DNA sulfur modification protein DndE
VRIETIRLSEKARTQLITLKRRTGIQHWNVLCRWAFCLSLKEASKPPAETIAVDSNVEMSWKVFGGSQAEIYLALLKQRAYQDKVELNERNISDYFRLHLHRGISYLVNHSQVSDIGSMLRLVAPAA